MNKITGFNNNNINFTNINKEKKVLSNEEKFDKLYGIYKDMLISNIEQNNFKSIPFEIPGTPYLAILNIKDGNNETRLSVGVCHKNRDRLASYNLAKGSRQDIIDYLKNEENDAEIKASIEELRQQQQDYYSTL